MQPVTGPWPQHISEVPSTAQRQTRALSSTGARQHGHALARGQPLGCVPGQQRATSSAGGLTIGDNWPPARPPHRRTLQPSARPAEDWHKTGAACAGGHASLINLGRALSAHLINLAAADDVRCFNLGERPALHQPGGSRPRSINLGERPAFHQPGGAARVPSTWGSGPLIINLGAAHSRVPHQPGSGPLIINLGAAHSHH
jgi:hypothetical protein